MQKRIQRSMVLIIAVTLLITYGLMTAVVYTQTERLIKEEIRQETDYICRAIEISGTEYLQEMDSVRASTRVTWISAQGEVLYDSTGEEGHLENHASRPEIVEAFETGFGEGVRDSDTLGERMFYCAKRLSDGTVIRASKTYDTAFQAAVGVLPVMAVIALIMMIVAWHLSKTQVEKLIEPINKLDLEHPMAEEIYDELAPLLERIDKQNKEKDAVANMRKEFSANVSHELKTPLTSISGYAEIMMNGLVPEQHMKNFSERIYNEAGRLITLIEDIIKLSRLDEGSIELEKEEVDLFAMSKEVVNRLSVQAEKKKVQIELGGESVTFYGIKRILDEIIYNICDNAIKYNKENGKVSVWVSNTPEGTKIVVQDTGIGIPVEYQERIFERFFRVDKSHSRESGGTGLGLSIVKHGAMLHNITIDVESEVGIGTKVEMRF